jgi:DNA-binding transcriptional ArsR family regulator
MTTATHGTRRKGDLVFRALAHPARRRILDLLRRRPRTTGALAGRFALSRFGVMQHLRVLEEARLVVATRRGRERWNHLNPAPVADLYRRFVTRFAAGAAGRLIDLRESVEGGSEMTTSAKAAFGVSEVVSEVRVEAPPGRVWHALTEEIGRWWPAGFFSSPKAKRMVLEPRVGGRFYEDWGEGDASGLLWYTVIGLETGRELRLSGELSPDWGGPAHLSTRWTLKPEGDGTLVRLEEVVYGRHGAGTPAKMTEGWNTILGEHMKPFVEASRRKTGRRR